MIRVVRDGKKVKIVRMVRIVQIVRMVRMVRLFVLNYLKGSLDRNQSGLTSI
jgi:hypothetical protein